MCVSVCVYVLYTESLFPSGFTGGVPASGWCRLVLGGAPPSVLAQVVPFGDLPAGVFAHVPPVGGSRGGGAVEAEQEATQDLVLGGPVEVDHQELHRDLGQKLGRDVVDEGLIEDWV